MVDVADRTSHAGMSFSDMLADKVRKGPDSIAVVTSGGKYSWSDIDTGAHVMALDLAAIGVGRRSHVALVSANSINWIMAFYAIQKLGAIALLVNPSQLPENIGETCKAGDATHIVYGEMAGLDNDPGFLDSMCRSASVGCDNIYSIRDLDMRRRIDEAGDLEDVGETVLCDDVALMIFTSGSTGVPKGVLHSAYNILTAAYHNSIDQTLCEDDRICLILPLYHIFGLVAGMFAGAVSGAVLYIPDNIRTDTLIDMIHKQKCTVFHSVPTMLIALINNKNFSPDKMESLRCTIISGAAATRTSIVAFRKAFVNDRFLSSYGLSEMAPVTISDYNDTDEHLLDTVGHPVSDAVIKIADIEDGSECGVGVEGEIIVKGNRLMTGYYKASPEDQAIDGSGWIHTRDLGYMTDDGYLVLTGRLKDIIIRGGENIMPAQIENAIAQIDRVEMVKVMGVPDDFYGEEIAACIVLKQGAVFDRDEFGKEVSGKVARFRIPKYFEVFDEFPILGTGKIDLTTLKNNLLDRLGMKP